MSKRTHSPNIPEKKVTTIRLTITKTEAKKLSRVARWEKASENTSLTLIGRY